MLIRAVWLVALYVTCLSASADDWPQWLGPKRDSVWRETGVVMKFPAGGPRILWRTPIHAGYSGPSVAEGRVYVTERENAERNIGPSDPFARGTIPGKERILCLNEKTGKVLWKHEYDCAYTMSYPAGPRVTPLVHEGKVYSLGAEGNLICLSARTARSSGRR